MEGKKEEVPPAYANDMPDLHDEKPTGAIVAEEAVHSVALTEALAAGPKPSIWSKSMLQLYAIMAVGYLVSTLNGYDSSLMGAINAMKSYQNTVGLTGEGSSTGIIFIIYNCEYFQGDMAQHAFRRTATDIGVTGGQIAAFPFCGFLADGYGRRICIFVGCALVLVGKSRRLHMDDLTRAYNISRNRYPDYCPHDWPIHRW